MVESMLLGQIPGTTYQVSFELYMISLAAILLTILFSKVIRRNYFKLRASFLNRKAVRLLTSHHLL